MEILIMFIALTALAILGPLYGKDSRDLRDHPWETNPWDDLPIERGHRV
jgi:hypothetical protein